MTDLERLGANVGAARSLEPRRPTPIEQAFADLRVRLRAIRGRKPEPRDVLMAYDPKFLIDPLVKKCP